MENDNEGLTKSAVDSFEYISTAFIFISKSVMNSECLTNVFVSKSDTALHL